MKLMLLSVWCAFFATGAQVAEIADRVDALEREVRSALDGIDEHGARHWLGRVRRR
jgi:hypothetical protein